MKACRSCTFIRHFPRSQHDFLPPSHCLLGSVSLLIILDDNLFIFLSYQIFHIYEDVANLNVMHILLPKSINNIFFKFTNYFFNNRFKKQYYVFADLLTRNVANSFFDEVAIHFFTLP